MKILMLAGFVGLAAFLVIVIATLIGSIVNKKKRDSIIIAPNIPEAIKPRKGFKEKSRSLVSRYDYSINDVVHYKSDEYIIEEKDRSGFVVLSMDVDPDGCIPVKRVADGMFFVVEAGVMSKF